MSNCSPTPHSCLCASATLVPLPLAGETLPLYESSCNAWNAAVDRWVNQEAPFNSSASSGQAEWYPHQTYCLNKILISIQGAEYQYEMFVCNNKDTIFNPSSCCPGTIDFPNGCNPSHWTIGTKWIQPLNCDLTSYTNLKGSYNGSSLKSFAKIFQITDSSNGCYNFELYNPWGISVEGGASSITKDMTRCLAPLTVWQPPPPPPVSPPPPWPPPSTTPPHPPPPNPSPGCSPDCGCGTYYQTNEHFGDWWCSGQFIEWDRATDVPVWALHRNGLPYTPQCMSPWEGTFYGGNWYNWLSNFYGSGVMVGLGTIAPWLWRYITYGCTGHAPFNRGHNVPCWLLEDINLHIDRLKSSAIPSHSWTNYPYHASLKYDPHFGIRYATYGLQSASPRILVLPSHIDPVTSSLRPEASIDPRKDYWPPKYGPWYDKDTNEFFMHVVDEYYYEDVVWSTAENAWTPVQRHDVIRKDFLRCTSSANTNPQDWVSSWVAKLPCITDPNNPIPGVWRWWRWLDKYGWDRWRDDHHNAIGFNPIKGVYGALYSHQTRLCAAPEWEEYPNWLRGMHHPLNWIGKPLCNDWWKSPTLYPNGINPCRPTNPPWEAAGTLRPWQMVNSYPYIFKTLDTEIINWPPLNDKYRAMAITKVEIEPSKYSCGDFMNAQGPIPKIDTVWTHPLGDPCRARCVDAFSGGAMFVGTDRCHNHTSTFWGCPTCPENPHTLPFGFNNSLCCGVKGENWVEGWNVFGSPSSSSSIGERCFRAKRPNAWVQPVIDSSWTYYWEEIPCVQCSSATSQQPRNTNLFLGDAQFNFDKVYEFLAANSSRGFDCIPCHSSSSVVSSSSSSSSSLSLSSSSSSISSSSSYSSSPSSSSSTSPPRPPVTAPECSPAACVWPNTAWNINQVYYGCNYNKSTNIIVCNPLSKTVSHLGRCYVGTHYAGALATVLNEPGVGASWKSYWCEYSCCHSSSSSKSLTPLPKISSSSISSSSSSSQSKAPTSSVSYVDKCYVAKSSNIANYNNQPGIGPSWTNYWEECACCPSYQPTFNPSDTCPLFHVDKEELKGPWTNREPEYNRNLTITQGDTVCYRFAVYEDGLPLDIVGMDSEAHIKLNFSDDVYVEEWTAQVVPNTINVIELSLTAEQTECLPITELIYSCEIKDNSSTLKANNTIRKIIQGYLRILPEVTRDKTGWGDNCSLFEYVRPSSSSSMTPEPSSSLCCAEYKVTRVNYGQDAFIFNVEVSTEEATLKDIAYWDVELNVNPSAASNNLKEIEIVQNEIDPNKVSTGYDMVYPIGGGVYRFIDRFNLLSKGTLDSIFSVAVPQSTYNNAQFKLKYTTNDGCQTDWCYIDLSKTQNYGSANCCAVFTSSSPSLSMESGRPLSSSMSSASSSPSPAVPKGACCLFINNQYHCATLTEYNCTLIGGVYQGDGVGCDSPNPCYSSSSI